jgi:hypothetical protein
MAKMFYTLEEAAEKLGKTTDEIKSMAEGGKLQQFRDGPRLMFKREQVDGLAASAPKAGDSGAFSLADDESSQDKVDLSVETTKLDKGLSASATGISVFDADQGGSSSKGSSAFNTSDEELTLDSVGSGSGLLDLTREEDNTSLGAAELLEEVGVQGGGTDIFAQAGSDSAGSGMNLEEQAFAMIPMEEYDGPGDGLTGGVMLGVFAVLIVGLVVAVTAMSGQVAQLTASLASNLVMYAGVMVVACLVLGGIGMVIGKSRA